jgi:hypothetical protein
VLIALNILAAAWSILLVLRAGEVTSTFSLEEHLLLLAAPLLCGAFSIALLHFHPGLVMLAGSWLALLLVYGPGWFLGLLAAALLATLLAVTGFRRYPGLEASCWVGVGIIVLILMRSLGPWWDELRAQGNLLVTAIERFRKTYGRYPCSLKEAGIDSPVTPLGSWHYRSWHDDSWSSRGHVQKTGFTLSVGRSTDGSPGIFWDSDYRRWQVQKKPAKSPSFNDVDE